MKRNDILMIKTKIDQGQRDIDRLNDENLKINKSQEEIKTTLKSHTEKFHEQGAQLEVIDKKLNW